MRPLDRVLEWHWRRYPLLQPEDIYKFIHQGVFGPGHIVADPGSARDFLARELGGLSPADYHDTPDTEPLDPENRFIRVNLVPLVGVPDAGARLAAALVESARARGDDREFRARLALASEWFAELLPHLGEGLAALGPAPGQVPVYHHSTVYRQAYRPAYRVVLAALWPAAQED
jgi:hypothetical protein